MANICDCAVAISKHDLEHNDTLKEAIKRLKKPVEGYELIEEYKSRGGDTYRLEHTLGSNDHYTRNGKPITLEEWRENIDWTTYKRVSEIIYTNGWSIDLGTLGLYTYQSGVDIAEFNDHLTLYFGGRWDFPIEWEDKLNSLGVEWQGAGAEGGCEYYDSNIGNKDFGLRWYKGKDEEGYNDWWVEDTTGLGREEVRKFEKELA